MACRVPKQKDQKQNLYQHLTTMSCKRLRKKTQNTSKCGWRLGFLCRVREGARWRSQCGYRNKQPWGERWLCHLPWEAGVQRDKRAGWVRWTRMEVGARGGGADPPERGEKRGGGGRRGLTCAVGAPCRVSVRLLSRSVACLFSLERGRSGKLGARSRISGKVELLCSEFGNSYMGCECEPANILAQFSQAIP